MLGAFMNDASRTSTLERQVGRILTTGIVASSVCLAVGLVLALAGREVATATLLKAGTGILLATPAARVVAAAIDYLRQRDWLFGGPVIRASVDLFGPLGGATFHPEIGKNLLCIAGGSGIAGMMSILSRACQEGYFEDHLGHVFFGVRAGRDVFFLDELEGFQRASLERLRVTVALSDEDVPEPLARRYPAFTFARGLVHAVAAAAMNEHFANVRAYLAGPPPMVDAALSWLLREARLKAHDIRYDKFS